MMNKAKTSGFTLIEVVITMFVMTVGLLGLAGLQTTSIKDGLDTATRSQALWLATEIVERVRANSAGQATGYNLTIEDSGCASAPTKQCSDNGSGDASNDCTANEMAAFDIWEVFCGQRETNVLANATDSLQLTSVTTGCGGTCTAYSNFIVSLNWESLAVGNSSMLGEKIDANKNQSIIMIVRP